MTTLNAIRAKRSNETRAQASSGQAAEPQADAGSPEALLDGSNAASAGAFARISSNIVGGLFLFVLVGLTILAAVSTSYISFDDGAWGNEHTFFVPDNMLINCIVVCAFFALAYFVSTRAAFARFHDRLQNDDRFFRRCKAIVLAILAIASLAWLGLTLAVPGADQGTIQKIVIAAQAGDWSGFAKDGYMNMFPNQVGYFWISYLFAPLFHQYTSAFMQLFNIAGLLLTCEMLGAIASRLGASRTEQLACMCLCLVFYPIIMYCSFVYGILWGLGLSLFAIRFEMDFFDTWKWQHALACAACIAAAIVFKSNYQIFLIAMALYALVTLVDVRKIAAVGLIALFVVAYGLSSAVPNAAAEAASGHELGKGASSWSWIAMGLQDGIRAPGWYNSYNVKTFKKADYDGTAQAEIAKDDVRKSLSDFASGKRDAVSFFTKKVASQWNNPTFQGYWNVQKRRPAFELCAPVAWFMSAKGEDVAINYLNALQMILLIGALIWAIACAAPHGKFRPYRAYVLPLALLGGFLCHLFWEGKSQYILSYFVLLFPFCTMGIARAIRYLQDIVKELADKNTQALAQRAQSFISARKGAAVGLAVSVVLVIAIGIAGGYAAVTDGGNDYESWLASNPSCPIIDKEPFMGSSDADRFM